MVVPSELNENAPLSVLEAYAAGRPVIGSQIAGIPELVRQDETGLLYATGDSDALAAALDRFAALSDSRLAVMGAAGRRWAEVNFSVAIYRQRLLDLYRSILGDAP